MVLRCSPIKTWFTCLDDDDALYSAAWNDAFVLSNEALCSTNDVFSLHYDALILIMHYMCYSHCLQKVVSTTVFRMIRSSDSHTSFFAYGVCFHYLVYFGHFELCLPVEWIFLSSRSLVWSGKVPEWSLEIGRHVEEYFITLRAGRATLHQRAGVRGGLCALAGTALCSTQEDWVCASGLRHITKAL